MKSEAWSGLVTHASEFALPLGAAAEQVNFHNAIPGQLTSRGGMGKVLFVGAANTSLDCHAVQIGDRVALLTLAEGGLVDLSYPTSDEEPTSPEVPLLDASNGTTTNYLWQYATDSFGTVDEPDPEDNVFVLALNGGASTAPVAEKCVDSEAHCGDSGALAVFDGGRSTTSVYPATIRLSEICDCQE